MNAIIQRRTSSFPNPPEMCYGSRSDSSNTDTEIMNSVAIDVGDNTPNNTLLSPAYDNAKNIHRDSSFASLVSEQAQQTLIQARTPAEIAASFYHDMSWNLFRGLGVSILTFLVGVHGPKAWVLPLMGGLTLRPIPYQVTAAGDVLLDLQLANDLIPKTDVTFPCE
jgi:hypothetical protein